MIKDGGVFNENVTINVAEQTATFHVPLREGADEANVVHDFRKVNFAFSVLTSFFLSTMIKLSMHFVCTKNMSVYDIQPSHWLRVLFAGREN